MIDIHTHILPCLDDGSEDGMIALRTVHQALLQEDIDAIFLTPHSDAFDRYPDRFPHLLDWLRQAYPGVPYYPGCEVRCEPTQMDRILQEIDRGRYPSMNKSLYVLAEFSDGAEEEDIFYCLTRLTQGGWKPILAHVERYRALRSREDLIRSLLDAGVLLQVNTYNLSQWDAASPAVLDWARALVRGRLVAFLGTDTHGLIRRPPVAKRALEWLYTDCGEDPDYIAAITSENARKLLIRRTEKEK